MEKERLNYLKRFFYDKLLNDTMKFWIPRCVDSKDGGFLTYLDRQGRVLNTDKSGWVQGRLTWLFSRMYNEFEKDEKWLTLGTHGYKFLKNHIIDETGRGYFTVTKTGEWVRRRRYLFTEVFAVIGFAEYYRASHNKEALNLARKVLNTILELSKKPDALEPKYNPIIVKTRTHSATMSMIFTLQVMRDASNNEEEQKKYTAMIDTYIEEIFKYFVHPEKKALLETVGLNGELLNNPAGRCINPGHAIETAWFIITEGRYRNDTTLIERALPILDWSLELGWDKKYGGLFSFLDVEGYQPEQVEWDMKYWWPHTEAMYATLLAHHLTGKEKYLIWFEKLFEWSYNHFPDPEYGEWFGYLHRDGTVALTLKGNNWKSPFHLARHQLYTHLLLKEMLGGN